MDQHELLDHAGTMRGIDDAYVGPVLVHVRGMQKPSSCHVDFMLSQDRHIPFKPLLGPKRTRRFRIMSGPCWSYMDVYGAYVGPTCLHLQDGNAQIL